MISWNFCKLSLEFSSLVPSTAPTYSTLPLKVFGIPALVFFLVDFFACLPWWPSLSKFWSYCWCYVRVWVCGPLVSPCPFSWMCSFLDDSARRLLVGILLFPDQWNICTLGSALLLLSYWFIGVPIRVLVLDFCQRSGFWSGICFEFLSMPYLIIFFSYLLK